MKQLGFVPQASKTAAHETRNGILMCGNHHLSFDAFHFYIRWVPEVIFYLFESMTITYPPYRSKGSLFS